MGRLISYVIPCYRSELTITGVVNEIQDLMKNHLDDEYEIILVNDSSPDNVWDVIENLAKKYVNVFGYDLAKNFGQHAALLAGYSKTKGDIIVSLDDDGQIAVEDTYKIIDHMDLGYDVVYGKYASKKHSILRNIGSEFTRQTMIHLMDMPKDHAGSSFYAMKRYIVDEMLRYHNAYVFLPGLVFRATNKVDSVFVGHRSRVHGESGYTLGSLIALWLNGATTFSIKPLRVSSLIGCCVAFIGLIFAIIVIIRKMCNPSIEAGWSSLVCITMMLCGTILIVLGLIGEYVGRLYMSANSTPQFVIRGQTKQEKEE